MRGAAARSVTRRCEAVRCGVQSGGERSGVAPLFLEQPSSNHSDRLGALIVDGSRGGVLVPGDKFGQRKGADFGVELSLGFRRYIVRLGRALTQSLETLASAGSNAIRSALFDDRRGSNAAARRSGNVG